MTTRIVAGWNNLDTNATVDGGDINVSGSVNTVDAPVSPTVVGSVATGSSLATIVTLVANGVNRVTKVSCSGEAYAKFQLFINTILKDTRRSGPDRNTDFTFENPLTLTSGDVLDVKVTHYSAGDTLSFETTIYGFSEV